MIFSLEDHNSCAFSLSIAPKFRLEQQLSGLSQCRLPGVPEGSAARGWLYGPWEQLSCVAFVLTSGSGGK